MKTTYFWKAIHEPDPNTKYVSISLKKQRGAEDMPEYSWLMPSWDIVKMAHDMGYDEECFNRYKELYFEQLSKYNPASVYEALKDCTLVCFESSKDIASGKKFCHRRMVAGWIEENLGIIVPEEVRDKEAGLIVPAIYKNKN